MSGKKMVAIDKEKLQKCFKRRGVTQAEVQRIIGVGTTYFSSSFETNRISVLVADALEAKFNIKKEEYVPEEVTVPVNESVTPVLTADDWEHLYKVIYSATYEAMKRALSGE